MGWGGVGQQMRESPNNGSQGIAVVRENLRKYRFLRNAAQVLSTPGWIRTNNPRFRRPMRYPVAPRVRAMYFTLEVGF